MSWQRAVFFGGALLVLSACGDATAPSTLRQVDGTVFAKRAETTDTTTVSGGKNDECSSIVIHVGLDGSLTPVCVPLIPPTVLW